MTADRTPSAAKMAGPPPPPPPDLREPLPGQIAVRFYGRMHRPSRDEDLAVLARFEARLDDALARARAAYWRVDHLRDLVDALRATVRK